MRPEAAGPAGFDNLPSDRSLQAWSLRDWAFLALGCAALIATALYCERGRIFWEDEMLGWMLLRDPSFAHMVSSWRAGADGGGFSFYLTGRAWLQVFGTSVVAYRAYTQVCFAAAFAINWAVLRRFYSALVATFASLCVWLISPVLVDHLIEGRFYGLLLASIALGIWLCFRATEREKVGGLLWVAMLLTHGVMVTSHLLGVAYSLSVLVMMFLLDRRRGWFRPGLYAAIVLPWMLLIPSLSAIRASAAVGKPYFWTQQPRPVEFLMDYAGFTPLLAGPLILAVVALWVLVVRKRGLSAVRTGTEGRADLYVVAGVLACVPVVFYAEGWFAAPLCIARYLQPMAFFTTYFTAEIVVLLLPAMPSRFRSSGRILAGWILFLACLGLYEVGYRAPRAWPSTDYTEELTRRLPSGVPVICEDAFTFTEMMSRQHDAPVQYRYLLDWRNALAPKTPRLEVTQFHLMENWKKAGYFSGSIEYAPEFLAETPHFYTVSVDDLHLTSRGTKVLADRSEFIGSSLHTWLMKDTRFRVKLAEKVRMDHLIASVWSVCRVDAPDCR